MSKETEITYKVEGLSEDRGRLRLNDLVFQLDALIDILKNVDRDIDDSPMPRLDYIIKDVLNKEVLVFVIEPLAKRKVKLKDSTRILRVHDTFIEELNRISIGQSPSAEISNDTIEKIRTFTKGLGKRFAKAVIHNQTNSVEINEELDHTVKKILNQKEKCSIGSVTGKLEAISLRSNNFWIYPELGPQKVKCEFDQSNKNAAIASLDQRVTLKGTKYFRHNSYFPYRVKVEEISVFREAPGDPFYQIKGTCDVNEDTYEKLDQFRDEWDS